VDVDRKKPLGRKMFDRTDAPALDFCSQLMVFGDRLQFASQR